MTASLNTLACRRAWFMESFFMECRIESFEPSPEDVEYIYRTWAPEDDARDVVKQLIDRRETT